MELIELIKTIILGIIQGITEWLPISSTGHMILADEFIKLNISQSFKDVFFVVIQLGSILAVVVLYFHKLNPFSPRKTKQEKSDTFSLWYKVLIACIPAGVIGLLFDDKIHELLYGYQTVAITLIVYGVLFIVMEKRNQHRQSSVTSFSQMSYKTAVLIGAFQMLSLIPGTSRSGATILGAVLLGCSRFVSAEFSFYLAIPTMLGASGYKMLKYGMEYGFGYTGTEWAVLITGMLVAFVVSIFAIKFLMGYIKKHDFKAFGYYRIILGILILGYFTFLA